MSIFGGITGDYGEAEYDRKRQTDLWNPQQKQTAGKLWGGVIKPGFEQNIYSGQPTDIEQTAIGQLKGFGEQTPAYMDQAGGALSRALTGTGYQPIVDPAAAEKLYGAIEDRTMKDILPKAVTAASTQANVGGMLRSGTGQKLVTDEIGKVVRALQEQLATLKYADEQERRSVGREREGRQLQAIPQAGGLSAAEFSRIQPGLQYGGAERDIAGTQFDNPLIKLALSFLNLRGGEETKASGTASRWDVGGKLGLGIQ
jgi:hypothetical protein